MTTALHRRALLTAVASFAALATTNRWSEAKQMTTTDTIDFKTLSEAEWRKRLTPSQYNILRDHGTERAGTSPLNHEKRKGTFACAGCDLPLFSSDTKFDSGTGWPSF
jgi:peptide-methionine (R)-S-oxide reductase